MLKLNENVLSDLLAEALNEADNSLTKTPYFDMCYKVAVAGKFTRKYNYEGANKVIKEIIDWLKSNRHRLSERVNYMIDFADAADKLSKDIEKIYKAGAKKGFFDPFIISDGSSDGKSNFKKIEGLAQAVTYLIWSLDSHYLSDIISDYYLRAPLQVRNLMYHMH